MDITIANTQWANRPSDERYANIPSMLAAAIRRRAKSVQSVSRVSDVSFEAVGDDGLVVHRKNLPDAGVSNYAFVQACNRLDYPPGGIVDKVDAALAASILNHRVSKCDPDMEMQMLVDSDPDGSTIRSVTSGAYTRFWDDDVIRSLSNLESRGWVVPPARPAFDGQPGCRIATEEDLKGLGKFTTVQVGDELAPAGLYMGDRDMFALMVHIDTGVDRGDGNPLFRARMMSNSEVGARTFSVVDCSLDFVCGNHILWNVNDVKITKWRHIGDATERINKTLAEVANMPVTPLDRELAIIKAATGYKLGDTFETVVDNVYKLRIDPAMTRDLIEGAIANAAKHRAVDGDPYTLIGLERAITRYSQEQPNQDKRFAIDTAAGKLVQHFINKNLLGAIPQ